MRRPILALAVVLLFGACGDDDTSGADDAGSATTSAGRYDGEPSLPDPGGATGPAAVGPLSVAAALDADDGDRLTVEGFLIALPDGTATLCGGAIMESAPPRCADPALPVDGLADPASLPGTQDVGGWVQGDVQLAGTVRGGRLQVP